MMQIANVDIRSLLTLNESIDRTIDALNQVRLSAYGTVTPSAFGVTPAEVGLAHAAAQNPFVNAALASQLANSYANVALTNALGNPFTNPYAVLGTAAGLGHTAFDAAYANEF